MITREYLCTIFLNIYIVFIQIQFFDPAMAGRQTSRMGLVLSLCSCVVLCLTSVEACSPVSEQPPLVQWVHMADVVVHGIVSKVYISMYFRTCHEINSRRSGNLAGVGWSDRKFMCRQVD